MIKQWKTIEKSAYLGLAVTLLIVVVVSSISYQSLIRVRRNFKWVANTKETLLELSHFLSELQDAEIGQRGYLLTNNECYLKPYQYVENGIEQRFAQLRIIATGNVSQQSKLDLLEQLVQEKLTELREAIDLQKSEGPEAAKDIIFSGRGKQIMDNINQVVLQMSSTEDMLLSERDKQVDEIIQWTFVVKSAGVTLIVGIMLLVSLRIKYWFEQRQFAEKKRTELLELKSDFVSTVSHELRTPLTAIGESISIVLDESAGSTNREQKQFLDIAKRNVDRLSRLINNVLDFQEISKGKMVTDICLNDINEVVEEVVELMRPWAKDKTLKMTVKLGDNLPKLKFDKDKIIGVLTNIVNNAIKYTDSGEITITTTSSNNAVIVSVRDTGCGIAESDIPKVFNKFQRTAASRNLNIVGSGLGLAISKEIIKKHRGKIWVESELGKGSTFSFLIPVVERRNLS